MEALILTEAMFLSNNSGNATNLQSIFPNLSTEAYMITTTNSTALEPQTVAFKCIKWLAEVLTVYFTPVITIAGTIGNVLSVLVFFCTKLKKLSSSYYLAALGVSDTGFLWCNFIQWISFLNINLYKRNGFCQLFTWLSGACSVLSVWLVVAFTIERFVAVMYPLKRPTLCTVRRARCILFYLILFNALNSSPLLLFATSKENPNSSKLLVCTVHQHYEVSLRYYNYYDFFVAFLIPLTLIITLNTVTAYTVWKLARVRRTMTNHKRKKGNQAQVSAKREHQFTEFSQSQNDQETSENSIKITNCSHLNGHHNVRQSCFKTSILSTNKQQN